MTRIRQLVVLFVGAALILSACEAFDEGSGGPGPSAPPGSAASTAPGSTAGAGEGPAPVALGAFSEAADGAIVRIVGRAEPWSDRTIDGHQAVRVTDSRYPGAFVVAWIPVSATDPPKPNTMAGLPSGFSIEDLVLTTEDGTVISGSAGESVALTGVVVDPASGDGYLDYVTRIELAGEDGPTGTPEPGATGAPAATAVTIADFDEAADGAIVSVVGLIQVPGSTSTVDGHGSLRLQDATDPSREITVWIPIGSGTPPPPNTMGDLPTGYRATDLVLTADDGMAIHHGDAVALTGSVTRRTGGGSYLDYVTRIEVAKAPLPKPLTVNFNTIKKQKAGTLVRLTGRLDVGFLTSCFETCGIYLEDPATGATVSIRVTLGTKNQRVPNTMWPLPSNYKRSDLRVIANDKRVVKGGARVRVTGWIQVGTDKKRRIDPVIRIDYVP